ncbi:acyltransferase family protein [Nocardioides luteus]|uniref:acyltransferase family protein n=1 Tax=Nocardioides luteus TaxID=1844 RepID=UPI0018C8F097|nr:acyltransferase family protein [Nocardioides luteus]MBG6097569.1 peptidoglycan/LPS O-acetylase OafA/YrhL [Nocardioides luteus]
MTILTDTPSADPDAATRTQTRAAAYRPDIQALRAIAVLSVFAYHLAPGRLSGGYVGVDVFFVISGFLIGSHLLRELETTGRIRLGAFWARRAKRLLPASLLVLLVSAVATFLWVPRSLWSQFLTEIAASSLYVENWRLAWASVDYLAADNKASAVQHFWSLSVEEQFYLFTPVLLLLVALLSRWIRPGSYVTTRRLAGSLFALVVCASFTYGVWLTANTPEAYFSTFTRAWEFAAGVLVGLLPMIASRTARALGVALGLVLIATAATQYTSATPFPGVAALVPVSGAALAIWLGRGTFLARVGSWRPVSLVGDTSYAIYLWHWPLIVLVPYITDAPLNVGTKLVILGVTFPLAWLSTTQWENRVRFSARLLGGRSPATVGLWSAAAMAVVLAVVAGGLAVKVNGAAESERKVNTLLAQDLSCLGAAKLADPTCEDPDLEGVLVPDPSELATDEANRAECWSSSAAKSGDVVMCRLGPETGYSRRLLAVGDSHNDQLVGAYEDIAHEFGWRIDVAGRVGCYWTEADLQKNSTADQTMCEEWRRQISAYVEKADDLDAILTSKARNSSPILAGDDVTTSVGATADGLVRAWAHRPAPRKVPVIAIEDNPAMPEGTMACVEAQRLDAASACAQPRRKVLPPSGLAEAVAIDPNAVLVDLTDLYCEPKVCRPVVGHVIVYRDDGEHLTLTYTRTLAPYLGRAIEDALRQT